MLSERTCHLKLSLYSSYKNTPPYERVHLCYNAYEISIKEESIS